MKKPAFAYALSACAAATMLSACSGGPSAPSLTPVTSLTPLRALHPRAQHAVGLGKLLVTRDGGQIFGFDIDRNGTDGVLATASDVETFDQNTGTISKTFPKKLPPGTSYGMNAIFAGDVALVTRYVVPQGQIYAKRFYDVMNPVTKGKFTNVWSSPIRDINVQAAGVNQVTSTDALFAIELKKQDRPVIVVSDIAKNTVSKVFHLDPNLFGVGNDPQFGQDTTTNQAVVALSPDGGAVGGEPPLNVIVDLSTGKETRFNGFNNGFFHAGDVNGLAVDSTTGIAATTTELNAQVEFYDLAQETGTFAQLPCTTDTSQINSGSGVANDPVNGLFLVTDTDYACGSGSAIVVYDEKGNNVETITGFKFAIGEPAPVINPATRTGWAFGPGFNQLQQFFY
jgi:hypothetical protein